MIFDCCYKCKDRTVGCHSVCNKYKEAYLLNEDIKKKVKLDKIAVKSYNRYR